MSEVLMKGCHETSKNIIKKIERDIDNGNLLIAINSVNDLLLVIEEMVVIQNRVEL